MDYTYETKGAQRVAINHSSVRPSPNATAPRRSAFDLSHRRRRPRRPLTTSRGAIARSTCSSSRRLASSFVALARASRSTRGMPMASRSRVQNGRVQSSSPSARRRRRQVMRWLANPFFTIGRWCGLVCGTSRGAQHRWALVQDD